MFRRIILLGSLALLFSLGMTPIAHAMEQVGCIDASTSTATGHSEGDRDEVPADGKNGYLHHHAGCQGHPAAVSADVVVMPIYDAVETPIGMDRSLALHGATTAPALRPPQA